MNAALRLSWTFGSVTDVNPKSRVLQTFLENAFCDILGNLENLSFQDSRNTINRVFWLFLLPENWWFQFPEITTTRGAREPKSKPLVEKTKGVRFESCGG